ncbi:MAG TPA: DUF362 domain-containing protein [Bacteroidales bacterium]|mgnify:CR=1 FL=1|jgi:hypothetical protein|nr:DUF362 domain-containing protein [Bacteroidales bacterium]
MMMFRISKHFFAVSGLLLIPLLLGSGISSSGRAGEPWDDGPNQPAGTPSGIHPGRVVWAWNPDATNENCRSTFETGDWYWKPENTNETIVGTMFREALGKLSGDSSVTGSWDRLFHHFNMMKKGTARGYIQGEKIFIKIIQGQSRWILTQDEKDQGYYLSESSGDSGSKRRHSWTPVETGPYIVLELLRELVGEMGINEKDIAIADPFAHIYGHNYDVWSKEFPDVMYCDRSSADHGRTLIKPTEKNMVHFSDNSFSDKIYDVVEKADYTINVSNLRMHGAALISLTAKNHLGSITSPTAKLLHYTHLSRSKEGAAYEGYFKYRALVDIMGSSYLGQNTILSIVDALFGGGSDETRGPVKYFMSPFNYDWCNSIFLSQDQVALESVCYDFLRAEWDGVNRHDPHNNEWEIIPDRNGIDDYLHQAADPANWPEGLSYDPDGSGHPLKSLGVHEHWNDPVKKQYSRNLGKNTGIELISIPDSLVRCESAPEL